MRGKFVNLKWEMSRYMIFFWCSLFQANAKIQQLEQELKSKPKTPPPTPAQEKTLQQTEQHTTASSLQSDVIEVSKNF